MKKILFVLFIGLMFVGCKKKGCTDPAATNYDPQAKKDDGSCLFADTSNNSSQNVYIDVHCHLKGLTGPNTFNFIPAADSAIVFMDKWKIDKMLIMPPPFTNQSSQDGERYEIDDMVDVLNQHPDRFYFLGGGKELNVMIQQEVTGAQSITTSQFIAKALEIASMDGFVGFGEITTLHFSLGFDHVFEQADPDDSLFFALVDVAAQENVPISIHQEAVPDTMLFPSLNGGPFPANPDTLYPNIDKFKTLLNYANTKNVKIIWDHVGWDNTLEFTTTLCRSLLDVHDNLYFSIKTCPDTPGDNKVVDSNGNLKNEWLQLFKDFEDHFMIGADHFHRADSSGGPPSMDQTWSLIDKLPEDDLKRKIGYENAKLVFNLN